MSVNSSTFENSSSADSGGAIDAYGSIVHISNSVFHRNKATNTGGSISVASNSKVDVVNCTFNNSSSHTGGVLVVAYSDANLSASNFTQNSATDGGVFALKGHLFVKLCNMQNNTASGTGGVGYMTRSHIFVTESNFYSNKGNLGGVFHTTMSTMDINNSTFLENLSGTNGGVIAAQTKSALLISNATITRNNAKLAGGVLWFQDGTKAVISKTIIQDNSADACGALKGVDSSIDISSSLFVKNVGLRIVGVLCIGDGGLSIVKNSKFNGNTGYTGVIYCQNSSIYMDNCTLRDNVGKGAGVIQDISSRIYLSKSVFNNYNERNGGDIVYFNVKNILTYDCEFNHDNITLSSTMDNFTQIAVQEHFVEYSPPDSGILIEETPFASSKHPMY